VHALDSIDEAQTEVLDEAVRFQTGDGIELEGIFSYRNDVMPTHGALIVPPHPHFAGNMENNVVSELSRMLAAAGYLVMRFNYRGIGGSAIELPSDLSVFDYWETIEREARHEAPLADTVAAAEYLLQALGEQGNRLHIIGYSFGAVIGGLATVGMEQAASLTAICTPWKRRYDFSFLYGLRLPKAFINGKDDFVFDPDVFATEFAALPEPRVHEVLGTDHFYRGEELQIAGRVCALLDTWTTGANDGQ